MLDPETHTDPRAVDNLSAHAASSIAFACAAMLVSYLPFSAVNGVLGELGAVTQASSADVQWFADAFALALAAVVLPAGSLSERLGARTVTLAGLGSTGLGGATFALAGSVPADRAAAVLWIAQAISGTGGGAVMSASLALITRATSDPLTRRRGIAVWAAALTCGLGAGPFVAAGILAIAPWQLLSLPVLVLAMLTIGFGAWRVVEPAAARRRRVDAVGSVLSTVTICALVYAVIQIGSVGWGQPATLIAIAIAVIGFTAFLRSQRHGEDRMLPLTLFKSRSFTAASIAAGAMLFSIVGTVFTMSLLFAHTGSTTIDIALRLSCLFAANAVASVAAARLQSTLGSTRVLIGGLGLAAIGAASISLAGADGSFGNYAWRMAIFGFGGGLVMATASAVAVSEVPAPLAAVAGAANNALRQVGAALGAAVLGSVLASQLHGHSYPSAAHTGTWILAGVLTTAAIACSLLQIRRHH